MRDSVVRFPDDLIDDITLLLDSCLLSSGGISTTPRLYDILYRATTQDWAESSRQGMNHQRIITPEAILRFDVPPVPLIGASR